MEGVRCVLSDVVPVLAELVFGHVDTLDEFVDENWKPNDGSILIHLSLIIRIIVLYFKIWTD